MEDAERRKSVRRALDERMVEAVMVLCFCRLPRRVSFAGIVNDEIRRGGPTVSRETGPRSVGPNPTGIWL